MRTFKPIKVLAAGVSMFLVGILWELVDFHRQQQILALLQTGSFARPVPVLPKILILSGALVFILGVVFAVSRLLDAVRLSRDHPYGKKAA